jgi:hypothetical protein
MQTYEVVVVGREIRANSNDMTLVRTSSGVDVLHVLFEGEEWLSFPLTATFGNGAVKRTLPMVVTAIADSDWAAESSVQIPWEVLRSVGDVRVTIQGTDASGNHIITAKGAPLSVEEAGDVTLGEVPEDAPTIDQWTQAYQDAMSALADAQNALRRVLEFAGAVATYDSVGVVRPDGTTITIDPDGTIRAEINIATETEAGIVRPDGDTITVDPDGTIRASIGYASSVVPGLIKVDGTTITIDPDGMIHGHSYTLPKATRSTLGGTIVGEGLEVSDGNVSVSYMTEEEIVRATPLDGLIIGDEVEF